MATGAVTEGDQSQQLALVGLLHAFSEAAGNRSDVEAMINHAMYFAFKEAESLHDDAIAWTVPAAEEDRATRLCQRNEEG